MAQNQVTVTCPAGAWTQLTNANATKISFQSQTGGIFIRCTTDATTPTEARGREYAEGTGELQKTLATLTALVGAARVWAKPTGPRRAVVVVDTD